MQEEAPRKPPIDTQAYVGRFAIHMLSLERDMRAGNAGLSPEWRSALRTYMLSVMVLRDQDSGYGNHDTAIRIAQYNAIFNDELATARHSISGYDRQIPRTEWGPRVWHRASQVIMNGLTYNTNTLQPETWDDVLRGLDSGEITHDLRDDYRVPPYVQAPATYL